MYYQMNYFSLLWCVWETFLLKNYNLFTAGNVYSFQYIHASEYIHLNVFANALSWCHQMETFFGYWPFVRGIQRSLVNSPHKGQWRGAFMFSLICAWINHWVNNREAGDLRHYCAHYDVIVMCTDCYVQVNWWFYYAVYTWEHIAVYFLFLGHNLVLLILVTIAHFLYFSGFICGLWWMLSPKTAMERGRVCAGLINTSWLGCGYWTADI